MCSCEMHLASPRARRNLSPRDIFIALVLRRVKRSVGAQSTGFSRSKTKAMVCSTLLYFQPIQRGIRKTSSFGWWSNFARASIRVLKNSFIRNRKQVQWRILPTAIVDRLRRSEIENSFDSMVSYRYSMETSLPEKYSHSFSKSRIFH